MTQMHPPASVHQAVHPPILLRKKHVSGKQKQVLVMMYPPPAFNNAHVQLLLGIICLCQCMFALQRLKNFMLLLNILVDAIRVD